MDVFTAVHVSAQPSMNRLQPERIKWLQQEGESDRVPPMWSRLWRRNAFNQARKLALTRWNQFDIEIPDQLYSLWGTLHPDAAVFGAESRAKQYLACNVLACCAAALYPMSMWSPQLLDTIVINGDRYHRESLANVKCTDYEFSLEDLNVVCKLENVRFKVRLQHVVYGQLYNSVRAHGTMNLAKALIYFFEHHKFGVLQCQRRTVAIGRTKTSANDMDGFFMYDCQSRDYPLFPQGQGATYVLHCRQLQTLLYSIVVTLNVQLYNVQFSLYNVDSRYMESTLINRLDYTNKHGDTITVHTLEKNNQIPNINNISKAITVATETDGEPEPDSEMERTSDVDASVIEVSSDIVHNAMTANTSKNNGKKN